MSAAQRAAPTEEISKIDMSVKKELACVGEGAQN